MHFDILIATIGVFLGELYGNIVGGGSLVTQIVLQDILQFDIKSAMALDNAAVIGSNIGMFVVLARKHSIRPWFLTFSLFQILGAVLGAWILVHIDPVLLKIIFFAAIVLLVIKNILEKEKIHQEKGFRENRSNIICISLAAIFMGAYNAAFVIGDWIIALLILTGMFSMKYQNAIFLLVFSSIISQPVAVYQYFEHGLIHFHFLLPMMLATILGGTISAKILSKIHSQKLEAFLKYLSIGLMVYLFVAIF